MQIKVALGAVHGVIGTVARITIQGAAPAPKGRHDILVLDCSLSMEGSIKNVRDDSQRYVNELGAADFVSVIIYSGHGTTKRIAGPTRADEQGKRLVCAAIQSHVRLIGTTVFSEPLEQSLQAARDAAGEKLVHHSILFSDGQPVPTRWDVKTEKQKAIAQAAALGAFGAFLSCIGYGVYYDDAFLRDLISANGGNGVYQHISEIDDFKEAIDAIKAVAEKMSPVSIELSVTSEKGAGSRAYRTTPEVTAIGGKGAVRVSALYEGGAEIFVELPPGAKDIKVEAKVDGKKVESIADKFVPGDQASFIRVLGVDAFSKGDLAGAQAMFEQTGDAELADNLGGAYSTRDVREAGNLARAYFRDKKFIGKGLKATGPNHNVLNALRTIIEDAQNVIAIPPGAYQRSGELTVDDRVLETPLGSVLQVQGYVSNQERFNFSVRALKQIMLKSEDGKGAPINAKMWRTYNMVLDGNLHMPELLGALSQASFDALQEAGVIGKDQAWKAGKFYTLDFRGLKLTSSAWANPTNLRLIDLMKEEAELEAEQKSLNARMKALGHTRVEGVDEGGIYHPQSKKADDVEKEYYSAPHCEYRLMGYKAGDYDSSAMTYDQADAKVKQVRQRLVVVRFMIRAITFSMEATRSRAIRWDQGKQSSRGKTPKLEQTAEFQGAQLKRVTWDQEMVCS